VPEDGVYKHLTIYDIFYIKGLADILGEVVVKSKSSGVGSEDVFTVQDISMGGLLASTKNIYLTRTFQENSVVKMDLKMDNNGALKESKPRENRGFSNFQRRQFSSQTRSGGRQFTPRNQLSSEERKKLRETLEDLFGTRGACIFDNNLNVLGKVPVSELLTTIKSVKEGIYAIVLDGTVDNELVKVAGNLGVKHIVGSEVKARETGGVNVLSDDKL